MDREWEPLPGGCTQLAAVGWGVEAGDDGSGGDGDGGDDGGAVRMSGVPAGKTCVVCGGSVVVVAAAAAVAVVAAVGRHP
jgi:hypothetical protein